MAVTSLEDLKKLSEGQEVELIGWDEKPFICKLKRPSLLGMVATGEIDNPLLNAAHILFHGPTSPKDVVSMKEKNEILNRVAKLAMVEPTYDQVKEVGLELTDMQLLDIFNFTQNGVQALISFRTKQQDIENNKNKRKI